MSEGFYCGQCGGQCEMCKRAEEDAAKKPKKLTSISGRVQRTLYIILTSALVLVLLPWFYRWSFVVRDFYFSYLMRVMEAS
jgi:hypothetical protein